MAIGKAIQTNFTSGVLDPKMAAREDTAFYYNGLRAAQNLLFMPYGGVTARPGLQFVRRLSGPLEPIDYTGATLAAPQGGTAAAAADGDTETDLITANNISTTNPFVIFQVDFGTELDISAIDVVDYRLEEGILDNEIRWQSSVDNASWVTFGKTFNWSEEPRSRRLRDIDGDRSAQHWRLVRIGGTDVPTKAIVSEVLFHRQMPWVPSVRLVPFAYSTDEAYLMAATSGNMDVFTGDHFQGSVRIGHSADHLATLNYTQSLDTLLIFHKDVQPERIFRQGGDDEFDFRKVVFSNIPEYDYGAGVGGTDEVQTLSVGGDATGDTFSLLLEGKRSAVVSSSATTSEEIQAALRGLPNTSDDGISVSAAGGDYVVSFLGEDGRQPWSEIVVTTLKGNGVWSVRRTVEGKHPGEPIMSDQRGWPRCGLIDAGRLHLGGITGVPDAHLMSTTTDYFDFNIDIDNDTKALMYRAETDQVGAIYNIVRGRHLTLFTNDGEFYYPGEAVTDESVLKLSTRSGIKEGTRVHEVDGALLFIQGVKDDASSREIGTSLREFIYEDTRQAYDANIVSKLSGHLIRNPQDNALRKAINADDADIEILINEDGTGTAYTVMRGDAVNALGPISTRDGDRLLAVAVDKKRRVYFAVERLFNGERVGCLERWNPDLLLDGGGMVRVEAQEVVATVDGQSVFVWTDISPSVPDAVGVRINGGRIEQPSFSVNMDDNVVILDAGFADAIRAGDKVRIASMIRLIEGADHLNGEEVKTVIDGTEGPSFIVDGGIIDLGAYADVEVQYGFYFEASGAFMPLRIPEGETLLGDKVRIVNALFELHKTGGIEIRANDGRWQEIPLIKFDDHVLDRSTQELLFTGTAEIRGLRGFAVGAPLEFRRPGPTPLSVLGVSREVSL